MVIAFFLMAAIGGVAFGIGRIFVLDSAISSLYENGTIAYYAAESGIEEGLLRYRFDQNAEVHADYALTNKCNRRNLDETGAFSLNKNADLSDRVSPNNQSIYDITVGYKDKYYGNDANGDKALNGLDLRRATYLSGDNSIFHIKRDESEKIDISGINQSGKDLKLYLKMYNFGGRDVPASNPAEDYAFVEAKATGTFGTVFHEYKKILATNPGVISDNLGIADSRSIVEIFRPYSGVSVFQIDNLIANIAGSQISTSGKAELTLKPVGCDIDVAIVPDSGEMTSPWTTVKSTGYYGDATRTLTAKIDRQSGTVYDLFDFVVYQHK